ncbi:hypothetical protein [Marivita sp. S2033]|uniref:hypothetical protein n=1 Tax=Marivita sp. S2033 TaxID=3373187 RepID=UPI00398235CD
MTDRSRSWLNGTGIAAIIRSAIDAIRDDIGAVSVVGLGNSMGGFMALALSRDVAFDAVFALTPQYSILPNEVPEETRWRYFRKRIETVHYPRADTFRPDRTKYFILHGSDESELVHALRFPMANGVSHFILPGCGHQLASQMKRKGLLTPIVRDLIDGRYRRMRTRLNALDAMRRIDFEARRRTANQHLSIAAE